MKSLRINDRKPSLQLLIQDRRKTLRDQESRLDIIKKMSTCLATMTGCRMEMGK